MEYKIYKMHSIAKFFAPISPFIFLPNPVQLDDEQKLLKVSRKCTKGG